MAHPHLSSSSQMSAAGSIASTARMSTQFLNSDSVGRLTRTYLVVAAQLKMERHGQLAEDISNLDSQGTMLDQEGKRLEAFAFKERALVLRQKLYGPSHSVVTECAKELGLQYSIVAMDLVRAGDTIESLKLLEKAEVLTSSSVLFPDAFQRKQLLAVMYNNFGCYYKFLGKFHTALKYLQKALRIESSIPGCQNPAGTHLNVCALLSQMGRHRSALHHAQLAIHILQQEREQERAEAAMEAAIRERERESRRNSKKKRLRIATDGEDQMAGEESTPRGVIHLDHDDAAFDEALDSARKKHDAETAASVATGAAGDGTVGGDDGSSDAGRTDATPMAAEPSSGSSSSESQNKTCLMVIALYNAAVEMEHIGAHDSAVEQYEYALEIAEAELGPGHSLAESVANTLRYARRAAAKANRLNAQTPRDKDADGTPSTWGHSSMGTITSTSASEHGTATPTRSAARFPGLPGGGGAVGSPRTDPSSPRLDGPGSHTSSQALLGSSSTTIVREPAGGRTLQSTNRANANTPVRLPTVSGGVRSTKDASWSASSGLMKTVQYPRTRGGVGVGGGMGGGVSTTRLGTPGSLQPSPPSRATLRGGSPRDATWSASTRTAGPVPPSYTRFPSGTSDGSRGSGGSPREPFHPGSSSRPSHRALVSRG